MSHPLEPNPVMQMDIQAVKQLYAVIQDLRSQVVEDRLDLLSLCNITQDIAGVEGILLACMHLEMINYDLMEQVTNILANIAIFQKGYHDHNAYANPHELAIEILADLPMPYVPSDDSTQELPQVDFDAEQILWDTARAMQEVQGGAE